MRIIFMPFILAIGIVVFSVMFVVGVCYTTIKHIIKLDYSFKKQFFPIFMNIALVFDGLANSGCGELLNDLFIRRNYENDFDGSSYKYGKWYDTISEVTGINYLRDTLKELGRKFCRFLDYALLERNHAVRAINKNKKYPAYFQTKKDK